MNWSYDMVTDWLTDWLTVWLTDWLAYWVTYGGRMEGAKINLISFYCVTVDYISFHFISFYKQQSSQIHQLAAAAGLCHTIGRIRNQIPSDGMKGMSKYWYLMMINLNLHLCMQLKRDQNPKTSLNDTMQQWKRLYYMACVFSRYNAHSDRLALVYHSPVMPTGRLRACIDRAKSQIINNSLTSNVRSLRENLIIKPRPCRIVAIARSIRYGLGLDFLVETSLSVNK